MLGLQAGDIVVSTKNAIYRNLELRNSSMASQREIKKVLQSVLKQNSETDDKALWRGFSASQATHH